MNRRTLLKLGAVCPAAWLPASGMPVTIEKLEVFSVKVNRLGDWILTRLTTNTGISGIGEATTIKNLQLLPQFFAYLQGREVSSIEWLRRQVEPEILRSGPPGAVAYSGLEHCLWDILGKMCGVPVYQLLGGMINPRLRHYANINRSTVDRSPEGFARMAEKAIQAGFDAVKLAPFDDMPHGPVDSATVERFMQLGIDRATAVRKVLGPDRSLLVDAHSRFDLEHGLELVRRLEPLNLFWLEEATPAHPVENLAAIRKAAKMPTAGGEMIYGVRGFYPYIKGQAVDIVMPDLKYGGGALMTKEISALAEAAGLKTAPHSPAGPVASLVGAHVCATMPSFYILEMAYGEVPWRAEVIDPPEQFTNGYRVLSDRPGYGATLNDQLVGKYRVI